MNQELFKLTNPQKSIWLTEKFYPNTSIGNICGTFFIDEELNVEILEKTINFFIKNNDALRAKITLVNGEPFQYIEPYKELKFKQINFSNENEFEEYKIAFSKQTFSLIDAPLFKFEIFKLKNGKGGYILCAHHTICDAWSLKLLLNKSREYYSKLLKKLPLEEENQNSYIDFVKSEKVYENSEKYLKDKAYWEDIFSSIPENINFSESNYTKDITKANRFVVKLSLELSDKINKFCKDKKISPFTLFMGIWAIYWNRFISSNDITIGTPILNRTNFKEKNTFGMFISTIPFKISIDNSKTIENFLQDLAKEQLMIFRHQKYPYDKVLEFVRENSNYTQNLYSSIVSYQNARADKTKEGVNCITDWLFNNNISEPLNLHIYDLDNTGSFSLFYDYQINLFDEQDMKELNNRILSIINNIIDNPNILIKNLDIITPEEKNYLIYDYNNTSNNYNKDLSLSDYFEKQVNKTPNKIALVLDNNSLTYKELNEKANKLAYFLKEKGAKPLDYIALSCNKNFEMIIATLAIIKLRMHLCADRPRLSRR